MYNIMKKLLLALTCLIGVMFFASCDPEAFGDLLEQKPNIAFVEEEGYPINNSTVYSGTELRFKVQASPNETSGSPLKTFLFIINDSNGTIIFQDSKELTSAESGTVEFTEVFVPKMETTLEITATVTDEVGKKNTAVMVITSIAPPSADDFIGNFKGNVRINCDVVSDTPAIDGEQIDLDEEVEITLNANENNEAHATFIIDETEIILTGERVGNKFIFDRFEYSTVVNLVTDININLNITMTGILDNDVLSVTGDVAGDGTTPDLFNLIQATLNGTMEGELFRVTEE